MDYFELFGLTKGPAIDRSQLARKYFELQRSNHPDFFTNATEAEKENALEQTAAINKAFTIFQNEDRTLEYFLREEGLVTTDEKFELPPDFLMDMLEINEAADTGNTKEVKDRTGAYEAGLRKEIQPIIDKYADGSTGDEALLKLKEYHYKKKYLKRILDRLVD